MKISECLTSGPWSIDGDAGEIHGEAPADSGRLPVCQLLHDPDDADRCAADAAAIRAIPDLCDVLEALVAGEAGAMERAAALVGRLRLETGADR